MEAFIFLLFVGGILSLIYGIYKLQKTKKKNSEFFAQYSKNESKPTQDEKTQSFVFNTPFPDRIPAIIFHASTIDKGFKTGNYEQVNLSYAKLVESVRQQNINDPNRWEDHLNKLIGEYEAFRTKYGYEYPQQFLPPKGHKSIITPTEVEKNNGIVINPKTFFKLTLYNAPQEIIYKVKSLLEDENVYDKEKALMPLFTQYNIKCREIEKYIETNKPLFENKIESFKNSSTEWSNASLLDKQDILQEFEDEAVNCLHEQADCDLKILFKNSNLNLEIDDLLIQKYGFELIAKYLRFSYNMEKIHLNYERKEFEDLIKAGLAIGGDELPLEEILKVQTLKVLNQIARKPELFFKRKDKVIEYILTEEPIRKSINQHISTRRLFKLKPIPDEFQISNLQDISDSWNFVSEYIRLVYSTYYRSKRMKEQIDSLKDVASGYKVINWNVKDQLCVCLRSKEECNKRYSKTNPPKLPFHVGCTCDIEILF